MLDMVTRAAHLPTSHIVRLEVVFSSKETRDIATHIKQGRVLIVERWALVGDAVVHGVVAQDLPRVTPVELVVQIGAILREVGLV